MRKSVIYSLLALFLLSILVLTLLWVSTFGSSPFKYKEGKKLPVEISYQDTINIGSSEIIISGRTNLASIGEAGVFEHSFWINSSQLTMYDEIVGSPMGLGRYGIYAPYYDNFSSGEYILGEDDKILVWENGNGMYATMKATIDDTERRVSSKVIVFRLDKYFYKEFNVTDVDYLMWIGDKIYYYVFDAFDGAEFYVYDVFSDSVTKLKRIGIPKRFQDMQKTLPHPSGKIFAQRYCLKMGFEHCKKSGIAISNFQVIQQVLSTDNTFFWMWDNNSLIVLPLKASQAYRIDVSSFMN